jgi:hypothetical protein
MRCSSFKTLAHQLLAQVSARFTTTGITGRHELNLLYEGLNKSAVIQKISLDEAEAVSSLRNAAGKVNVHVVDSNPAVINPNGKS